MKMRLFFPLACALLSVACNRHAEPRYERITVDTLLDRGNCRIEVSYDFLSMADAARNEAFDAVEQANIGHFFGLEGFAGSAREAVRAALGELEREYLPAGDEAGCGVYAGSYRVEVRSEAEIVDSLLVFTIDSESYLGGAHGMYTKNFHVYTRDGGYELLLGDLFDGQARESLCEAIRSKLLAENGVSDDEGLRSCGFFPDMIAPTENFRPTAQGGILFYYNPYDVACYARGPVEVSFSREELEALGM